MVANSILLKIKKKNKLITKIRIYKKTNFIYHEIIKMIKDRKLNLIEIEFFQLSNFMFLLIRSKIFNFKFICRQKCKIQAKKYYKFFMINFFQYNQKVFFMIGHKHNLKDLFNPMAIIRKQIIKVFRNILNLKILKKSKNIQ